MGIVLKKEFTKTEKGQRKVVKDGCEKKMGNVRKHCKPLLLTNSLNKSTTTQMHLLLHKIKSQKSKSQNTISMTKILESAKKFSFKYILRMRNNVETLFHTVLVYYRTRLRQSTSNFIVKFLIVFSGKVITLMIF